jgi:hypothetical protein
MRLNEDMHATKRAPEQMSDFGTFISRIESPALLAIAQHWNEVRANGRIPGWADLEPSAIAPHLTRLWSFKYDRQSSEFTARLAGNRIMVATGHSFRGTTLKDLHPPHIYEKSHAEFTRIVTMPAIYRCRGPLFRAGGNTVEGERIVLPLAEDGEHGDGLLGASEYQVPPVTGIPFELISENAEWYSL